MIQLAPKMSPAKNPRIMITLPQGLFEVLEKWAALEGNKPTSLAASIVENALRQAVRDGFIKLDNPYGSDDDADPDTED